MEKEEYEKNIEGLRKQLANWENIFFNIKLNSKGEFADATYYLILKDTIKEFLDIYEKYKVSDTCSIERDNIKDFLKEIMSYYVEIKKDKIMEVEQQKKEVRNSSQD